MSGNFYVLKSVKFTFGNEIEAMHERSLQLNINIGTEIPHVMATKLQPGEQIKISHWAEFAMQTVPED